MIGCRLFSSECGRSERPDAANARHKHQIVLVGLGNLGEDCGQLVFVQRASKGLLAGPASPFSRCICRAFSSRFRLLQVFDHQVEQVDVLDSQPRLLLGNVFQQEANVLPDPQFFLGRVVEDVEGDLVADAAPAQEFIGR